MLPSLVFECQTKTQAVSKELEPEDECMFYLCREMETGLSCGHVFDMGDVWNRYVSICNDSSVCVPLQYSQKTIFYEEVQRLVGDKASHVGPLTQ